jgi:hypothetical protein
MFNPLALGAIAALIRSRFAPRPPVLPEHDHSVDLAECPVCGPLLLDTDDWYSDWLDSEYGGEG